MSTERRRLACFAALAAFASLHWFGLVVDSENWRWVVCVGICAGGAVTLLGLRGKRWWILVAGSAAGAVGMVTGGLLAIGIPLDLVVPWGWDELSARISGGLQGVSEIDTPYNGPDAWTRLAILAAVPLALAAATVAAFWPARGERIGRAAGLATLILLYATSVTWESPGSELMRGAVLFALVAAVLWLPSLEFARAPAAAAAALLALVVASGFAARVDASDPLISYTDWRVFGDGERVSFDWEHTYGELDWPQEGTEMFVASSDEPLYWKTYVLDEFDGTRWVRRDDGFGQFAAEYALAGASVDAIASHPEWVREFEVEVGSLRSGLAVTAGTPRDVNDVAISTLSGDGTADAEDSELAPGTRYEVEAYVPDPSAQQLRDARGAHPPGAERYTALSIPVRDSTGSTSTRFSAAPPWGVVKLPLERFRVGAGEPIEQAVEGTPYARVLRLAQRITAGARTDFAAVARIEQFLNAGFSYDQTVPLRQDPLPAFLFEDRAGYCQQFSGAMALMLRMVGIPARVVSGFAPGTEDGGTFTVSDTDAHSWVEVLYPGIGWVTVDPTPGSTPANTLASTPGADRAVAGLDRVLGRAFSERSAGRLGPAGAAPELTGAVSEPEDSPSPLPFIALLIVASAASAVVTRRRRRLRSPQGAELQLRELSEALRATGREQPPGATLAAIGEELSRSAGPEAARYVAGLRESRYGRRGRKRPGLAERREFRRAIARRAGALGWWRALRAVPPGGPRA